MPFVSVWLIVTVMWLLRLAQARQARNSLANAVLRATSGQRDPRNGSRIDANSNLRAPQYNLGSG